MLIRKYGEEVYRMENPLLITSGEIAVELGISKSYAYKIVKRLNDELKEKGFVVISGKTSRKLYEEKFYGLKKDG
jgi:Mn-dependent DtxR family transcriptional regulator